ncbi:MAG: HAD family hydrolase [Bryobacteraceae bacterium]
MATPLKAVIFDYGRVLTEDQDPEQLAAMQRIAGLPPGRLRELYWAYRPVYDRGGMAGPDYWTAIARDAGTEFTPDQIAALIQADNLSWSRINAEMLAWAQALAGAGIRTAILSNMPADLRAHLQQNFNWVSGFHHATFSCDVHANKPDAAIYRHCLEGLNVVPTESLFLDDRPENVRGAESLGIHGVIFASPRQCGELLRQRFDLPVFI